MSTPEVTDPIAFANQYVGLWLTEATQLRDASYVPSPAHPPPAFYEALLLTRGRLDRLEELMRQAKSLHGGIKRKAAEVAEAAEDAWDAAAVAEQRRGSVHDYETGRERAARFNTATLEQRRQARIWQRAAELAGDGADRIRDMHQGMNGVRNDLAAALRYFALESNVER